MVNHFHRMDAAERACVEQAIAAAEAKSHARFVLSIVRASDRYALYPVLWAGVAALIAGGILAYAAPLMALREAFAIEAGVFVVLSLLLEWRPLRLLLVPGHIKRAHASQLAHREFAARILAHQGHAGILLFVAEGERFVELLADRTTHERVGEAEWRRIVAAFTAQMRAGRSAAAAIGAIEACAALLEQHYPRTAA